MAEVNGIIEALRLQRESTRERMLARERRQGRWVAYFLWFVAGSFFGYLWMAKAYGLF